MSLDERLRDLENKKGIHNYFVMNLYPHLTKAECIREYENGNKELYPEHLFRSCDKMPDDSVIYWITVLPEYFKNEHIKWMDKHLKQIDDLINNKGYSLNRIYDEFYGKEF